MSIPKQVQVISRWAVAVGLSCFPALGAGSTDELRYAASIAFIQAGTVAMTRTMDATGYELVGDVATSAMLKPFYSWSGHFAASGRWAEGAPASTGYFLDSVGRKGRRSLTIVDEKQMKMYRSHRGWKVQPAPEGVDMMSVLFATQGCFRGEKVHDGEDTYPIALKSERSDTLSAGPGFYSGTALRCRYEGRDLKGRERKVSVWLATPSGFTVPVPVKIVIAVPRAPNGILRLRLGSEGDPEPA